MLNVDNGTLDGLMDSYRKMCKVESGRYVVDGMLSVWWLGINREIEVEETEGKVVVKGLFKGRNSGVKIELFVGGYGEYFDLVEDRTGIKWSCKGSMSVDGCLMIDLDRYDSYVRYEWNEDVDLFLNRETTMAVANDHRSLVFKIRKVEG